MQIIVARHVTDTGLFGEPAELVAATVVEDVDVELVGRPVDIHCGQGRVLYDAEWLIVSGDEQIDCGPEVRIVRQRHWGATQGPERLHIAEKEDDEGIGLGEEQQDNEKGVQQAPY